MIILENLIKFRRLTRKGGTFLHPKVPYTSYTSGPSLGILGRGSTQPDPMAPWRCGEPTRLWPKGGWLTSGHVDNLKMLDIGWCWNMLEYVGCVLDMFLDFHWYVHPLDWELNGSPPFFLGKFNPQPRLISNDGDWGAPIMIMVTLLCQYPSIRTRPSKRVMMSGNWLLPKKNICIHSPLDGDVNWKPPQDIGIAGGSMFAPIVGVDEAQSWWMTCLEEVGPFSKWLTWDLWNWWIMNRPELPELVTSSCAEDDSEVSGQAKVRHLQFGDV